MAALSVDFPRRNTFWCRLIKLYSTKTFSALLRKKKLDIDILGHIDLLYLEFMVLWYLLKSVKARDTPYVGYLWVQINLPFKNTFCVLLDFWFCSQKLNYGVCTVLAVFFLISYNSILLWARNIIFINNKQQINPYYFCCSQMWWIPNYQLLQWKAYANY